MTNDIHPMVPVPQALRTVLQQTAATILDKHEQHLQKQQQSYMEQKHQQRQNQNRTQNLQIKKQHKPNTESISLSLPSEVVGRIASETVHAPNQGYPPYNASIMDGYAINTNDIQLDLINDNSTIKRFQIVSRVHAGSRPVTGTSTSTSANTSTGIGSGVGSTNNDNTRPSTAPPVSISPLKKAMHTFLQNDNLPKAIYVTTGAVVPYPTYNTVIPIEQVNEYISNQVIAIDLNVLRNNVKPNMWIRNVGCDIKPNSIILKKGCRVESVHVGLLLQCGIIDVRVQCLPIVGILSTGNEIMSIEDMKRRNYNETVLQSSSSAAATATMSTATNSTDASLGMIPDANSPVLTSLLTSYQSCKIINYGIVNDDDIKTLTQTIQKATSECNVLITSGGVSMGEKDVIEEVLHDELGCEIHFGRLHMKPGKPTTFATLEKDEDEDEEYYNTNYNTANGNGNGTSSYNKCLIFAMPGNPVSAYVCTELLVRPCLDMLHSNLTSGSDNGNGNGSGNGNITSTSFNDNEVDDDILTMVQNANVHSEIHATLTNTIKLDCERPEYHRVKLNTKHMTNEDGQIIFEFTATSTGVQRSSRLLSMCNADGLMMLPQGVRGDREYAEEGESYPVLLLKRSGGGTFGGGFLNTIKLKDSVHYQNSSLAVGILEIVGDVPRMNGTNEICESKLSNNGDDHDHDGEIGDDDHDDDYDLKSRIMDVFDDDSIHYLQNVQMTSDDSISDAFRMTMSNCLDIILVVCTQTTFQKNLEISEELRRFLSKEAKLLSFQARKSASYHNPLSVLFDPVAGYCDIDGKSCMLMSLPNDGMEDALGSIKGLLKKGVSVAGGKRVGG